MDDGSGENKNDELAACKLSWHAATARWLRKVQYIEYAFSHVTLHCIHVLRVSSVDYVSTHLSSAFFGNTNVINQVKKFFNSLQSHVAYRASDVVVYNMTEETVSRLEIQERRTTDEKKIKGRLIDWAKFTADMTFERSKIAIFGHPSSV